MCLSSSWGSLGVTSVRRYDSREPWGSRSKWSLNDHRFGATKAKEGNLSILCSPHPDRPLHLFPSVSRLSGLKWCPNSRLSIGLWCPAWSAFEWGMQGAIGNKIYGFHYLRNEPKHRSPKIAGLEKRLHITDPISHSGLVPVLVPVSYGAWEASRSMFAPPQSW